MHRQGKVCGGSALCWLKLQCGAKLHVTAAGREERPALHQPRRRALHPGLPQLLIHTAAHPWAAEACGVLYRRYSRPPLAYSGSRSRQPSTSLQGWLFKT